MNPAKVNTDTKRNRETDFDDNLSRKLYPREYWTKLHFDMNQAKVLQLMMTTQAVNDSPEMYGQDYNGLAKKGNSQT